ncbi:TPA: hypothetical protein ACYU8D_004740 [Klebsiella pneumoniae]|uniref:hypothetical protein n=1 Tax=Klebsiella pneumoniae TaxID=573 RepID=UPI00073FA2D4|nr:hypothetical protein [Klebsiella pneumoniae]HAJ5766507.1 hypothetical protein [Escherichia coli]EIW8782025.1 hypothetical protein [Klebsiella pneumoniae]EKU3922255.1 hypothetical protein [Klebsiella pneumoniae]EKW2134961.1 hypothetical protein [Klebsiella pneumoniae]KAB1794679.1 hypothetical protein FXO02_02625 [Klebsiella pneumoniae]
MSHSPEYIKGALAALNEVQAVGLSMAMIAGVVVGKEAGDTVNTIIKDATGPLIQKFKEAEVKND